MLSVKEQLYTVRTKEFKFEINEKPVSFQIDIGATSVNLLQLEVDPSSKQLNACDN